MVFDKTGTITRPTLFIPDNMGPEPRRVLRTLADASDHPLARDLSKSLADFAPVPLGGPAGAGDPPGVIGAVTAVLRR